MKIINMNTDREFQTIENAKIVRKKIEKEIKKAMEDKELLVIDLDGGFGYITNYLAEIFHNIDPHINRDVIFNYIQIKSTEEKLLKPFIIRLIKYGKSLKYNKLVRDKIPSIIRREGGVPYYCIIEDEVYKKELSNKLLEECNEYRESENIEELADVLEVIYTLCDINGISFSKLKELAKKKKREKGSFKKKYFLKRVY